MRIVLYAEIYDNDIGDDITTCSYCQINISLFETFEINTIFLVIYHIDATSS